MRQLVYISTANWTLSEDELAAILTQSLRNNALEGVTGLLWSDGKRFIQVLEGPSASVREIYSRIALDERHRDLTIIRDKLIDGRRFGDWAMCNRRSYETVDEYDTKMRRLLSKLGGPLATDFNKFIGARSLTPLPTNHEIVA